MNSATAQDNLVSRPILQYSELVTVQAGNSSEPLVDVRRYAATIITEHQQPDMVAYTGQTILIRDSLAKKLAAADTALAESSNVHLKVVYGYRHPEVQQAYFVKHKAELAKQNPDLSDDQLNAATHVFVAVPEVGGHPAGAAVDVTLIDDQGRELDMGTKISDFNQAQKIQTFTSGLTAEQELYRLLLHDALVKQGLAPFYGEWWHFSYGDREWAAFCGKDHALFDEIDYRL